MIQWACDRICGDANCVAKTRFRTKVLSGGISVVACPLPHVRGSVVPQSVMLSALSACGDAQAGAKHLNGNIAMCLGAERFFPGRGEILLPLARTQNDSGL